MDKNSIRFGKRSLSVLYILYLTVVIVNVALMQRGVTNGIIERTGAAGYVFTYFLSFLMAGGCFLVSTIIQLSVYHANKKSVSKSLVPLIIFEAIKILGTAIYLLMIDCKNICQGGAVTAFIIAGIIIFVTVSVLEIVLMIFMNLEEKSNFKEIG